MLEIKDLILKFLQDVRKDIITEAHSQKRTASRKTDQSLEPEATDLKGILYGLISANVWETGRKPGKRPSVDSIYQWIHDKGLFQSETESRQRGIAFVISRSIGEKGSKLYRDGGRSGVLSNAITEERVSSFEAEVLRRLGREIIDEFVTTFTK